MFTVDQKVAVRPKVKSQGMRMKGFFVSAEGKTATVKLVGKNRLTGEVMVAEHKCPLAFVEASNW
mgnify:FL=1